MNPRIILLTADKFFTKFIYNGLKDTFDIHTVIFEEREDLKTVYKRRRKRIGGFKVFGQHLFDKYIMKRIIRSSKSRVLEIIKKNNLDGSKIPEHKRKFVKSVNDTDTIALIQSINPGIIIVSNTRILKTNLLKSVNGHFINVHSGILPQYRGYSGGYWALANNDKKNCGSTIHFVDEGIDTGSILCQGSIHVEKEDNYFTYAFLHLAKEIELIKEAVILIRNNDFKMVKNDKKGKIRYGPTIWEYFFYRLLRKVK